MTSSNTIRAFIAAGIPDEIRELISETGQGLIASTTDLKLVQPSNFHITLAFLGEIDPDIRETIRWQP